MRQRLPETMGTPACMHPLSPQIEPADVTLGGAAACRSGAIRRRYVAHVGVLALVRAARRFKHFQTDTYVLSYPKCGRTWLRLMLGRTFREHFGIDGVELLDTKTFSRRQAEIPRIQFTHDDDPFVRRYDALQTDKRRYSEKPVILLVREPKDVAVSMYFQLLKRDRIIDCSLREFFFSDRGGLKSIVEFYNVWERNRAVPPRLLIVRYEDMHVTPTRELRRILDFLGLGFVTDDTIQSVAEFASFERMQRMEREGAVRSFRLRPGDRNDPESYKVRKGVVGGHAAYLSPEDIAAADRWLRDRLAPSYGYDGTIGEPAWREG